MVLKHLAGATRPDYGFNGALEHNVLRFNILYYIILYTNSHRSHTRWSFIYLWLHNGEKLTDSFFLSFSFFLSLH